MTIKKTLRKTRKQKKLTFADYILQGEERERRKWQQGLGTVKLTANKG